MGHAYEEQLLPDRHALLFQMQAYATSEPEIRAHVRAGFNELIADRRRAGRCSRRTRPGTSSPTGCCSTCVAMLELDWMPERVIFRHRRAIALERAGARGWSRPCSRCRSSASWATRTTSTTRAPRRSRRATRSTTPTGALATPSIVALVRLGAPPTARAAQERIARVAGGAARPGRGVGGRLRAAAATGGWSRATAARPTCWRRSRTTPRARGTRIEAALARRARG